VVHILVAMMEPKNLDKFHKVHGCACLGVTVTVKLKGYDLYFHREQPDFVADPGFTPLFWRKKGDDSGNDGAGPDADDMDAPCRNITNSAARMDIDNPQSSNSSSHGKTVLHGSSCAPGGDVLSSIAVTPLNPNPTTPRGKEIVAEICSKSPGLIAKVSSRMVSLASAPILSPSMPGQSLLAIEEAVSPQVCMSSLPMSKATTLLPAP
jgi:hypothetical protein